MGQRVPLRLTPEYRFEYDDSIDEMDLVGGSSGRRRVAGRQAGRCSFAQHPQG
jgi:hypothetical protein